MTLEISIFEAMAEVIEEGGFKDKEWAKASFIPAPRISDCYRMLRLEKLDKRSEEYLELKKKVGRAFTVDKALKMIQGVRNLMGNKGMKKLVKKLDRVKSQDQRNFIKFNCLSPSKKIQLQMYLDVLWENDEGANSLTK